MPRLYIDGFREELTTAIASSGATSIVLPTGAGAKLASLTLSADNPLVLRIQNGITVETIYAEGRSTDTLTPCLRGQEGTTATTFPIGSIIRAPVTAVGMRELQFPSKRGTSVVPASTYGQHTFTITDAAAVTARDVRVWLRPTEELDADELNDYTVTADIAVDGTINVTISSAGYLAGTFAYSYHLT